MPLSVERYCQIQSKRIEDPSPLIHTRRYGRALTPCTRQKGSPFTGPAWTSSLACFFQLLRISSHHSSASPYSRPPSQSGLRLLFLYTTTSLDHLLPVDTHDHHTSSTPCSRTKRRTRNVDPVKLNFLSFRHPNPKDLSRYILHRETRPSRTLSTSARITLSIGQ